MPAHEDADHVPVSSTETVLPSSATTSDGVEAAANVDWYPHRYSDKMAGVKTVQMTLEPELVARVDRAARRLKTTRSGFARQALRDALARLAAVEQEARHRRGYAAKPVSRGEFDAWPAEQVWPE